jgi:acetyltransferase-like isoleucine patch superfamily enzyme
MQCIKYYIKDIILAIIKGVYNYSDEEGNTIISYGEFKDANVTIEFQGSHNKLIVQENSIINHTINIVFAANNGLCEMGASSRYKGFIRVGEDCSVYLGPNMTVTSSAYIDTAEGTCVTIGRDSMLATSVSIRTSDMHGIYDVITGKRINTSKSIYIGEHVWIGEQVWIFKGVKIGTGSIIGAKSLVTRNVPNNCIAVGNPIKIVKKNVSWTRTHLTLSGPPFYHEHINLPKNHSYWQLTDENNDTTIERDKSRGGTSNQSFVENLCNTKNLIDIACLGKANQSSLSKWSKPNDAQRAIQNGKWDFAFHTDKEENPWWEITLDKSSFVEYIIIHNRKNMKYQEKNRKLSVDIFYDNKYHQVYMGDLLFGAEPDGLPLILPIKYSKKIEKIKITLQGNDCLHLSQVNILINKKKLIFIAKRIDGFGERLRAILNAMLIAEDIDGNFLFNWEDMPEQYKGHHSVTAKEKIFSKIFIDKFHIDLNSLKKMKLVELIAATKVDSFKSLYDKDCDAIVVQQYPFAGLYAKARKEINFNNKYKEIFQKIEFSESLEYAKVCANNAIMGEFPVAVHLRAGDIIYGEYRMMSEHTQKVIPFPIAVDLISNFLHQGYTPIIFGQDKELLIYLKEKLGAVLSSDLSDISFSTTQQAFFDIVLMSRCKQIYAGYSGFATVASWIGNTTIIDPYKTIDKDSSLKLIESAFASVEIDGRISPLQRAFSCWSFLYISGKKLADNEKLWKFLNLAVEYDQDNNFYHFIKACSLYNDNKSECAENILYERFFIADKHHRSIVYLLQIRFSRGLEVSSYMDNLKIYAESGFPMAALCVAIAEKALDNNNSFEYFKELFLKNRSDKYTIFDKYIQ